MPRLIIAMVGAIVFHVMLLMTALPEHEVVEPEVKGSGHVTISIMRRQAPVPEVIEEPVAEPDQVENHEETVHQEQVVKTIPLPPSRKSEPLNEIKVPVEKVVESTKEKKVVSKTIPAQSVLKKVVEPLNENPSTDIEIDSSAAESLRQPEPLETVNRPPAYPSLARKRGWQGTVLLEVDVQSDGMVKSIQINKSSSYKLLDREALDAVRKWRFSPGLKSGEPVPMKVIVPIHFLLQDN
jgi:protein TonB